MNIFDFNPYYFTRHIHKRVKKYNLSKGERKKCKSCKYFNKHLNYCACMLGKRKYASPNDIACDSHERRKK